MAATATAPPAKVQIFAVWPLIENVTASVRRLSGERQGGQRRLENLRCPVLLRDGEGASLMGRRRRRRQRSGGEQTRGRCVGATRQAGLSLGVHRSTEQLASVQQKLEKSASQWPPYLSWLSAGVRHRPPADSLLPPRPLNLSPAASLPAVLRDIGPRVLG